MTTEYLEVDGIVFVPIPERAGYAAELCDRSPLVRHAVEYHCAQEKGARRETTPSVEELLESGPNVIEVPKGALGLVE